MKVYVSGHPKGVCCVTANGLGVLSRVVERAKLDGTNTKNVADYRAILFGLYKHPEVTEVLSSNQLIVKQLNGVHKVKQEHLRTLWDRVMVRARKTGHGVTFTWISREDNPAGKVLG